MDYLDQPRATQNLPLRSSGPADTARAHRPDVPDGSYHALTAPPSAESSASGTRVRELIAFALRQLPAMRRPDGLYCLEIQAGDMRPRGRSVRYSAMVCLGLLKARTAGYDLGLDVDDLVDRVLAQSTDPSLTLGDLGLLAWVAERGDRDRRTLLSDLDLRVAAPGALAGREAMEVAWITIGVSRDGPQSDSAAARTLRTARTELLSRRSRTGLIRHLGSGVRARFPNFATQIYSALALSKLAGAGDDAALRAATTLGDAVIGLQRRDGGWPWLFDATRGRVVEPYEIYVVHQDAMAPMGLLEMTAVTGRDAYRAAAVDGLGWLYGRNDLASPMLDRDVNLLCRSIRRRRPWSRAILALNVATSPLGGPVAAGWRGPLEINRTDRPYHLGWILEAWCGREHLADSPQGLETVGDAPA
jgi:hypothetical protein